MLDVKTLGRLGKEASIILGNTTDEERSHVLKYIKDALIEDKENILDANNIDCQNAKENGINDVMLDRLRLTGERLLDVANSIDEVANWKCPLGSVLDEYKTANDLIVKKVCVPFGLIGIIFESRPNVVVDCSILSLKSGNACLLRGGKEAINTNMALVKAIHKGLKKGGLPENAVLLVEDTDRKSAKDMMELSDYLSLLIPRGGKGLIRSVVENAKVPVIQTGDGNCHLFLDKTGNIEMAAQILFNGKVSRPSVCNALESLLVHKDRVSDIPTLVEPLINAGVILHCDQQSFDVLKKAWQAGKFKNPKLVLATKDDWGREYLNLDISIKVVDSLEDAISHINTYSTGHSETVITEDEKNALEFQMKVDSACVYHNASTRFTDGGQLGLGAEIGISTQKLHARGPMGVNQLVTYKYIITGNGQVR